MDHPVSEPRLTPDAHDTALAMALGALSVSQTLELLIGRPSRPETPRLDADDPLVIAALGALSFSRSLRRWIEEASRPDGDSPARASTATPPAMRELLR